MNILILGATGFIGSAIARKLVDDGHRVAGPGRDPARVETKMPELRWIKADLAGASTATIATCLADIALGLAVLVRLWARRALNGMLLLTLGYLLAATVVQPALWAVSGSPSAFRPSSPSSASSG